MKRFLQGGLLACVLCGLAMASSASGGHDAHGRSEGHDRGHGRGDPHDQAPMAATPQIRSVTSGSTEVIRMAEASLLSDCPIDPAFGQAMAVRTLSTFAFYDGVCGGPDLPACGGRVTQILEFCRPPGGVGPDAVGLSTGGLDGGFGFNEVRVRVCLDETAQSDCTGPAPAAEILADGIASLTSVSVKGPAVSGTIQRATRRTSGTTVDGVPIMAVAEEEVVGPQTCGLRAFVELFNLPFPTQPCGTISTVYATAP
ncbi:MAG: hypothetical protein GC200_12215 [Tepidisphaera sp.]|nr:hypothetical protein [Tepidisphaera sp.]